jgi:hypothetical protein
VVVLQKRDLAIQNHYQAESETPCEMCQHREQTAEMDQSFHSLHSGPQKE